MKQGRSVLVLIDEVMMYAYDKISLEPPWRGRLKNFFQYLTQAATKLERCAVVASLLASEPSKNDSFGKEVAQELFTIFRASGKRGQPVLKEDVAEVLRRRFFRPGSIRDREAFRPHVVAAVNGIVNRDEETAKNRKKAEGAVAWRVIRSTPT